jgi:hypothetical protein
MSGFNQPEILAETEEWLKQLARQAVALDAADAEARMGTRISISDVLSYLASGMTKQEILADFPQLTREDIRACLVFAAKPEHKVVGIPADRAGSAFR